MSQNIYIYSPYIFNTFKYNTLKSEGLQLSKQHQQNVNILFYVTIFTNDNNDAYIYIFYYSLLYNFRNVLLINPMSLSRRTPTIFPMRKLRITRFL